MDRSEYLRWARVLGIVGGALTIAGSVLFLLGLWIVGGVANLSGMWMMRSYVQGAMGPRSALVALYALVVAVLGGLAIRVASPLESDPENLERKAITLVVIGALSLPFSGGLMLGGVLVLVSGALLLAIPERREVAPASSPQAPTSTAVDPEDV